MAADYDAQLTGLAAGLLCNAAQVYNETDDEAWLSGTNPVRTAWNSGMFGRLEMGKSFPAANGERNCKLASKTLRALFCLPERLPAVRLGSPEDLAASARLAPLMVKLQELARWLGRAGRPVTEDCLLHVADSADAAVWLDVKPDLLPYLWEHALVTGWFELVDGPDGPRSWVVVGKAAYRWADGDAMGALHVWATVFASVLARSLEVTADQAPEAARLLDFQGQGVALAVILFLARRGGVTVGDASAIVKDGSIGDPPTGHAKRAWAAWVDQFGDPARPLLRELAALRALVLPAQDDDFIVLSPLAQWALREQFVIDHVSIRLIPASRETSAADLVELVDGVSDTEFRAGFEAWLSRRTPGGAARDLLTYAESANADDRLIAINLVRWIGTAAGGAWVAALGSPQLRGYAYIALSTMAVDSPDSGLPTLREPNPDDLECLAADLHSVIGRDAPANPGRVATKLAEVVPAGKEEWVFGLLARGTDPNVGQVLEVLGRCHPDRDIARGARNAARVAARYRRSGRQAGVRAREARPIGSAQRVGNR